MASVFHSQFWKRHRVDKTNIPEGKIGGKDRFGGKDWYGWGSTVILKNQNENGSWVDVHGDVADTCFAILFLTRSNLATDLTKSIRLRSGIIEK